MPITYEIDSARNLIVYHASGIVTPKDAIDVIDRVVTTTNGKAMHLDILFLLDPGASVSQIDMEAIQRIKSRIETWVSKYPRAPIKCAIVSSPPEDAVGELWRAMTDFDPAIGEHTRTFRTASEAYAWLRPGPQR
ncbi:MAG TPA: hypothetical protein VEH07_05145 [Alphaproteobacteria bacterium]|nr:hypothetical protein [Alphaproteobacteria bacterium]